ncbi:hypothetical protein [Kocuria kalidii]|uniref:hypothetical protein n=1 Tax=Kocuria kalidii TaxID=3376283 RepID=UPI0037B8A0DA
MSITTALGAEVLAHGGKVHSRWPEIEDHRAVFRLGTSSVTVVRRRWYVDHQPRGFTNRWRIVVGLKGDPDASQRAADMVRAAEAGWFGQRHGRLDIGLVELDWATHGHSLAFEVDRDIPAAWLTTVVLVASGVLGADTLIDIDIEEQTA